MKPSLSLQRSRLAQAWAYSAAFLSSPHGAKRSVKTKLQSAKVKFSAASLFVKLVPILIGVVLFVANPILCGMLLCLFLGILIGSVATHFIMKED